MTENYYAAVENHFVERRGSPLFITPSEWQLVSEWEQHGIPLDVVKEAIDAVFERPKTKRKRRTLAYCRQAVEASFRRFREARFGERTASEGTVEVDEGNDVAGRLAFLTSQLDRAAARSEREIPLLAEAMRVTARELTVLAAGASPVELDLRLTELDSALVAALELALALDAARKLELEREAASSLASYRDRMPETVYQTAVRSAFIRRLRATFGVSPLSLF